MPSDWQKIENYIKTWQGYGITYAFSYVASGSVTGFNNFNMQLANIKLVEDVHFHHWAIKYFYIFLRGSLQWRQV